jgi:hypothetical protein
MNAHPAPPTPSRESTFAPEPRWPAVVAAVAAAATYAALPDSLVPGPTWFGPALIGVLALGTIITHHRGIHDWNRILGYALSGVLTLYLVVSLALLVRAVPAHRETPLRMLESATALWVSNVLVFALWYWRLDAGGPHGRDARPDHDAGAFLFPQMTVEGRSASTGRRAGVTHAAPWSPRFVDYLFIAFNTSTAFSPTDVPVLARWAKVLTMIQSSIALTTVVVLAARAVNIL